MTFIKNMFKDIRLDIIRATAIIFVVLIHSMGIVNDSTESCGITAIKGFYSIIHIGVPLFVMLSGALLLGKEEPLSLFFKKRFRRVLIPFVIWSIIVSLIHFFQSGERNIFDWFFIFIKEIFGDGVHTIYWYVYMILGLYLLTPILRVIVKSRTILTFSTLLCFALYYLQYFFPDFSLVNRFSFPNLVFIGYFLAGFALYTNDESFLTKKIVPKVFLFLYLLLIIISVFHLKFNLIPLVAVCFFGTILHFKHIKHNQIQALASILAKYSYGIYLSHFILISIILKFSIIYKIPLFFEPIVMATSVIIIDIALLWFIQKIKLSRFFM